MGNRLERWDVAVIGAGIAGASVAAELAAAGQRVVLVEQEASPGYHTTGRSAALYTTAYGPPVIRALTRASGPAFHAAPDAARPHPLLRPRGAVFIAHQGQMAALAALADGLGNAVQAMSVAQAQARLPLLRPGFLAGALLDEGAADIDVEALHRLYLRRLTGHGGALRCNAAVTALARDGAGWRLQAGGADILADLVVNAAGAWADDLARLAGVAPVGLEPRRRTAVLVAPPAGVVPDAWPMAVDVDETFYIKPDAGKLLLSPADETPSPPCDAQPDEMDVALAVDRVQAAFDLPVRRIDHAWAGLRSFVPDRCPVAGHAPDAPGFVWLAGQGGYGIQSAPALARVAAALTLGRALPADVQDEGVTAAALSPARVQRRAA